jgi:glucosamine--fructose-6-phosphate aminotransferase (isomerizing)
MKEYSHTWKEIISQPQTWRLTSQKFNSQKSLADFFNKEDFSQIRIIGCGSTHYLSQSVAQLISQYTGIPANASPSSDLFFFPDSKAPAGTLLIAISRSGTTTETLWALERFQKESGGPTVVITCYPDTDLAKQADIVLAAPDAQEQSIAQTRSFTSMFLLSYGLISVLARNPSIWEQVLKLPDILERIYGGLDGMPKEVGEQLDIDHYVFLGSGHLYGLANEAMLKTKEISLTDSEAYHSLEIRHGPMSMVNNKTLIVGLLSDTGQAQQRRVLMDMQELGANTLAIVEHSKTLSGLNPDYLVELNSDLDEWVRGPLYLPVLQQIAYHRALAKGLNPDLPTNLEAVIKLDWENGK